MAATFTLAGDWLLNVGNRTQTNGTGNLGVYATNGIAVTPSKVGLGAIDTFEVDPAGGYTFEYVASTGKVKAYVAKDPAAAGGADIVLQELANAVDITATIFNWHAVGR